MKSTLLYLAMLFASGSVIAAENTYNFQVAGEQGQLLGNGTLAIPFALGADGHGEAQWTFKPSTNTSTNHYWPNARALLGMGKGKADVKCKASWFTVNFNPGVSDNSAVFSWDIKKGDVGSLDFAAFAGSFRCADMKIEKPAILPRR